MRQARMRPWVMLATVLTMMLCILLSTLVGAVGAMAQTASGARAPRPSPPRRDAPVSDSLPSPAALRVLEGIPEPLTPARRVPPPPSTARSGTVAVPRSTPVRAPEAAYDTLRTGSELDTAAVPIPAPTQPLGNGLGGTLIMPDTLPPPPPAALPIADPVKPVFTPPSPAPGPGEPCWRLQVAAPAEKPKAESRRDAAQSLLTVPFTIEFEKGLYKVRTRDCMKRDAVDALKHRAADSGFDGVFVVDTHAAPVKKPAPARKPAPRTARKKAPR